MKGKAVIRSVGRAARHGMGKVGLIKRVRSEQRLSLACSQRKTVPTKGTGRAKALKHLMHLKNSKKASVTEAE